MSYWILTVFFVWIVQTVHSSNPIVNERFVNCFTLDRPLHGEKIEYVQEIPVEQQHNEYTFLGVVNVNVKISQTCPGNFCLRVESLSSSSHVGCVDVDASKDLDIIVYMNITEIGENSLIIFDDLDTSALVATFMVEQKVKKES